MEAIYYTKGKLEELKEIDIQNVNPETLVDIRDVKIDSSLPKKEKILQFISQIKNPYCYRHGKFVVKVSFTNTEVSLEERLKNYIRSKC